MNRGWQPYTDTRAPLSARAPRTLDPVKGVRGELHDAPAHESLIASETQHEVSDDLANKPSARILIETEVHGRVDLFQFIPFHSAASSQTGGKNNAA